MAVGHWYLCIFVVVVVVVVVVSLSSSSSSPPPSSSSSLLLCLVLRFCVSLFTYQPVFLFTSSTFQFNTSSSIYVTHYSSFNQLFNSSAIHSSTMYLPGVSISPSLYRSNAPSARRPICSSCHPYASSTLCQVIDSLVHQGWSRCCCVALNESWCMVHASPNRVISGGKSFISDQHKMCLVCHPVRRAVLSKWSVGSLQLFTPWVAFSRLCLG